MHPDGLHCLPCPLVSLRKTHACFMYLALKTVHPRETQLNIMPQPMPCKLSKPVIIPTPTYTCSIPTPTDPPSERVLRSISLCDRKPYPCSQMASSSSQHCLSIIPASTHPGMESRWGTAPGRAGTKMCVGLRRPSLGLPGVEGERAPKLGTKIMGGRKPATPACQLLAVLGEDKWVKLRAHGRNEGIAAQQPTKITSSVRFMTGVFQMFASL